MVNAPVKRLVIVSIGLCGVMFAGRPGFANEGLQHKDAGKYVDRLNKKLHLTDSQRSQVEQIANEYHARAESLQQQLQALRGEEQEKVKAVLTPEQQAKFQKMQHHEHNKRRWFGKMCHRG